MLFLIVRDKLEKKIKLIRKQFVNFEKDKSVLLF